ncbi:MAG: hypothetical protein AAF394_09970 [Planctomycetota bacterium]
MNSEPNAPKNRSGIVGILVAVHLLFGAFVYQLPGWPIWVGVLYSQPALLAAWTALANHAPGPFRFAMSLILLSLSTLACAWSSYLESDLLTVGALDIILGLIVLTQYLCLLVPMLAFRLVASKLPQRSDSHDKLTHRKNLSLLHLVGLMSASALAIGLWAMLLRHAEISESDWINRQYLVEKSRQAAIIAGFALPIVLNVLLIFGESKRISLSILILLVLALEIPLASAIRSLVPTVDFDLRLLLSVAKMLVSFHLSVFLTLVALRFTGVRMSFR